MKKKTVPMLGCIYLSAKTSHETDSCLSQRQAIDSGKVVFHGIKTVDRYPGTKVSPKLLPGISSMGYFDCIGSQDWGMELHRNEGIEICLQETGHASIEVDDVQYDMPAGALSITRPWQPHRLGDPFLSAGRLHWVVIDVGVRRSRQSWSWPDWCVLSKKDLAELTKKLRDNERPIRWASSEVIEAFGALSRCVESHHPVQHVSRMRVALNQLFIALFEMLCEQHSIPDLNMTAQRQSVILFFQQLRNDPSMLGETWTLSEMAQRCGMGRTIFTKVCHEITNTSPVDHLNRCRLEMAAQILRKEPQCPVTSIALDMGFTSSQYFASRFRKHFGMSPREWRACVSCPKPSLESK